LDKAGFVGWVPLVGIQATALPKLHGVYVVVRTAESERAFITTNAAEKGTRAKAYPVTELENQWLTTTPVLYIGKAAGSRGLAQRLVPFGRKATSHSGGRSIWQLADADDLLVAWRIARDASALEMAMIAAFALKFGQRPFANRRN